MMVNYSCQGSIKDAMSKTFDGRHPCPLCKLVREGRKNEKNPEAQQNISKFDLFAGQAAAFLFPPLPVPALPLSLATVTRPDPPLLPPPRPFFG
jgi:hypothetical protein